MYRNPIRSWLTLLATASTLVTGAVAQSNDALLQVLIKKGIITSDEATQVTKELAKANNAADVTTSSKNLVKLSLSGRFQTQYVGFGTSIDGAPNPVSTEHFFLRRIYVGVNAQFGAGFSGAINYDFANTSFDKAIIEWKYNDMFVLDAGLSKAPFGYEELTSSGNLRSIERSPITRYIDEPNNGRRLGASSYRTGLFVSGSDNGFFYSAAFTNPERNEYSSDGATNSITVNGLGGVATTGGATTNTFALYGTVGYGGKFSGGSYKVGYETGFLPDQGGPGATIGNGKNITLNGVFADVTAGNLNIQGEWEQAKVDAGSAAVAGADATPNGYWIQPAYKITPAFEAVVRYSYVDSDHRGVAISDGIRSAPSGGTMNTLNEWYVGGNWYIKGNDVKFQLGYIHGESNDTVKGATAHAQTDGVRSQMQVNF
ncbi:MAG TPA: porin [Candidatus Didemnitutus sp.]|jgi:phosphate-selective porin